MASSTNPYDNLKLVFPAADINDAYNAVNKHVTDMVTSITAINNAISNIPWDGVSQQDMEQVWNSWTKAITNLLGTEKDPSKGSMNIVLATLDQAAGNYSAAEQQLQTAFTQMATDITSNAPGQSGGPTSVLVTYENNDINAPSTFVEEIYSDDGSAAGVEGRWLTSG